MDLSMRNGRAGRVSGNGASTNNGAMGKMAGAAALGFVAGIAATQAKKAAVQGVSIAAGDWVNALKTEHRMVEKLFEAVMKTTNEQGGKREMLLSKIAYALTKHAVQEENVIYPAISHSTQHDRARELAEEHAQIKTFIYDLRNLDPTDPRWISRAKEFETYVRDHIREEEEEIFPALQASLSQQENTKLTTMMNWEGYKVA